MKKPSRSSGKKSKAAKSKVPTKKPPGEKVLQPPANPSQEPAPVSFSPVLRREYRLHLVAGRPDQNTADDIMAMWVSGGILTAEEATQRLGEVVLALRTVEGDLAGVSTSYPVHVPGLGVCWYYGMFVSAGHRAWVGKMGRGAAYQLFAATIAFLRDRSLRISENRPVGVVLVLENRKLQSGRWLALLKATGWQSAGTSPEGVPAVFRAFDFDSPSGGGEVSAVSLP